MAAGEGTRLRPLTERWPKPVLPIDGRPVIATLLRELARGRASSASIVVTGHLAEQVEALLGDGSAFGLEVALRAPAARARLGRRRPSRARRGREPPLLVTAADTVFAPRRRRGASSRRARRARRARSPCAAAARGAPPSRRASRADASARARRRSGDH